MLSGNCPVCTRGANGRFHLRLELGPVNKTSLLPKEARGYVVNLIVPFIVGFAVHNRMLEPVQVGRYLKFIRRVILDLLANIFKWCVFSRIKPKPRAELFRRLLVQDRNEDAVWDLFL